MSDASLAVPTTAGLRTPLLPAAQQPAWDPSLDPGAVIEELRSRAPLVTAASCYSLQRELSGVARGAALVVQAGDCAERFTDAGPEQMAAKVELLDRMADAVEASVGLPVVRIGRFAGQYAKPRSNPTETTPDGQVLPVYRGDAVNSPEPHPRARVNDPGRLLAAYDHAALALDQLFLRDLLPPFGGTDHPFSVTYASHEALLLDYEDPLVRPDDLRGGHYGSSGHMLWIGERTRDVDGAHIAFAQRVGNPVGVKIGPDASGADVARIVSLLALGHEPGRLSLIVRMGDRIATELPRLLRELGDLAGHVLWLCDPMHGNTRLNRHGQKTRIVTDVVLEVRRFAEALRGHGLAMAGLHLETTPEPVLECLDSVADLGLFLDRYTTACDPRLNADQTLTVLAAAAETAWKNP